MATASKFFQISSSILLEYVYADQSNLTEYMLPTTTYPIYKYLGSDNSDTNNNIIVHGVKDYRQDNCYLRDSSNKIKRMRNLIDPTTELSLIGKSPVYDTIKIHLIQGFNYESHNGFDLSLYLNTNYGKEFNLLQFVSYSGDSYWTMNPIPFMMNGKNYTSYIELKVLSSYNLIFDYFLGNDKDVVNELFYNGTTIDGPKQEQFIQCKFAWLDKRDVINNIEYAYESETVSFDINTSDDYSTLGAHIGPADNYDYIEYYGTNNGSLDYIEDFLNSLNNNGHDIIMIHSLVISEYLNVPGSEPYWVLSDTIDVSQVSDFGSPNLFRPIIKNDSAIAYKIDYILRFYDRVDNSQIIKAASMMSLDVNKYGKTLSSIQLDENPIQNIIYNKNVVKQVTMNRTYESPIVTSQNVLGLVSNTNIVLNSQNVTSLSSDVIAGGSVFDRNTTYADGAAKILINNTTSYIKFKISRFESPNINAVDLSGFGKAYLLFQKDDGSKIQIVEYEDPNLGLSKASGEVLFRISEIDATRILASTNRQFSIAFQKINDSSNPFVNDEKNTICSGTFYNQKEWSNLVDISTSEKYKQSLLAANEAIIELRKNVTDLGNKLTIAVNEKNDMLLKITDYQVHNTSDDTKISELAAQLVSNKTVLNEKDKKIQELSAELNILQSKLDLIKTSSSSESTIETLGKNQNDDILPSVEQQKPILQPKPKTYETSVTGGSTRRGGCPTPDMLILTDRNEWQLAEYLRPGDKVYTTHEFTGDLDFYEVTHVSKLIQPITRVYIGTKFVTVSDSHKFLTPNKGFVEVLDLESGDRISTLEGEAIITAIELVGEGEVMRIEVKDAHTYIVEGLISHNKLAPLEDNSRDTSALQ